MTDYGIKVSKPGYDVKTATPQQLVFSSKYPTLRIHSRGTGSVTHTGGRISTIYHGLGYVPMFTVYAKGTGDSTMVRLPYVNDVNESIVSAYADDENLYIEVVDDDFGYATHANNDLGEETSGFGYVRGVARICRSHPSAGDSDCALRFTLNVAKNATIYDARLHFWVAERDGSSNMYWRVWGIAEDNTGDFSSDPLGRSVTTHSHRPEGNPSEDSYITFGIKDAMNDVTTRSGWATGNNFGLIMRREPEFPDNNGMADYDDGAAYTGFSYLTTLTNDTLIDYKYTIFKDRIV